MAAAGPLWLVVRAIPLADDASLPPFPHVPGIGALCKYNGVLR